DDASWVISDPPPTVGLAAILLARRAHAKASYYYADSWADLLAVSGSAAARWLARPVALVERFVLGKVAMIIAVTPGVARGLYPIYPKVLLAHNGVDGEIFTSLGG